jgi:TPP-dependent pyruvate/acetoin dehydrogenase alpha subunit
MSGPNLLISLHQDLLKVRLTEETLAERYKQQEMRTPAHFGSGQEAVAVGVCHALRTDDVVYTHHRSHNHFLAKGGSTYELAAELYGRADGCSGGRGGSVHLTAPEVGFIASSAILGEMTAVAVGAALAFQMDKLDRVAVTFFGEGAMDEGSFYESANYASVKRLPVLFVCETISTRPKARCSCGNPPEPTCANACAPSRSMHCASTATTCTKSIAPPDRRSIAYAPVPARSFSNV